MCETNAECYLATEIQLSRDGQTHTLTYIGSGTNCNVYQTNEKDIVKEFAIPVINDCGVMIYFGMLKSAMETADEADQQDILLAAEISRQLLEGQEVSLP